MKISGVILIVGGLALAYGGFTYTTHKRAVDMGPCKSRPGPGTKLFIPPLLGVCGIVVGGALLFVSRSKSA